MGQGEKSVEKYIYKKKLHYRGAIVILHLLTTQDQPLKACVEFERSIIVFGNPKLVKIIFCIEFLKHKIKTFTESNYTFKKKTYRGWTK